MIISGWWLLVGMAVALGSVAGAWVTFRVAQGRFDARLRRETAELQQRLAATADQLRAGQVRAQTELEQARDSIKRQIAAAAEESRAAVARTEERLRAAYDELDRLRRAARAPDTATADLADGFAATRPMREGM